MMGLGIVFTIPGDPRVFEFKQSVEDGSYQLAAYGALIVALRMALDVRRRLGCTLALFIETDCEVLAMQMRGAYDVRDEKLRPFFVVANYFRDQFGVCRITHVPGKTNAQAKRLARKALVDLAEAA
jgi:ribonuclease HI